MDFTVTMKADTAPATSTTTATERAVPRSRLILFIAVAAIGCAADLLTKAWCFSTPSLRAGEINWLWQGHAGIQLSRNLGALFGMGQGKFAYFALLSVAAAIAIPVWLFVFRAARDIWLTFALGCVMGGVLGNLYDRLGLSGDPWFGPGNTAPEAVHAVRDWILWQVNDNWRWPNFNIADSLLVTGVGILLLHAFLHSDSATPGNTGEESSHEPRGSAL
jgi:signal peptidase II